MKTTTSLRIVKVLVIEGLLSGISFLFVRNEDGNLASRAGMGGATASVTLFCMGDKKSSVE